MKTIIGSALVAAIASANSRPIYGTYPGYLEGSDNKQITIELFMDYLCSACYNENPIIEQVMQQEWLGGTVADQVYLAITPFPLPYHVHSYPVAQLVPYFMDLCVETSGSQCFSKQYKDFSFAKQSTILGMKDTSWNDF